MRYFPNRPPLSSKRWKASMLGIMFTELSLMPHHTGLPCPSSARRRHFACTLLISSQHVASLWVHGSCEDSTSGCCARCVVKNQLEPDRGKKCNMKGSTLGPPASSPAAPRLAWRAALASQSQQAPRCRKPSSPSSAAGRFAQLKFACKSSRKRSLPPGRKVLKGSSAYQLRSRAGFQAVHGRTPKKSYTRRTVTSSFDKRSS
mmetsp:Transcript_59759/g.173131  ORF Transcript_59759/g.173131 Transcript_59759/m.173131 type:complete len:203 (-) Transcript_59759:188-796(-)